MGQALWEASEFGHMHYALILNKTIKHNALQINLHYKINFRLPVSKRFPWHLDVHLEFCHCFKLDEVTYLLRVFL